MLQAACLSHGLELKKPAVPFKRASQPAGKNNAGITGVCYWMKYQLVHYSTVRGPGIGAGNSIEILCTFAGRVTVPGRCCLG